jgi:hypothetical protein
MKCQSCGHRVVEFDGKTYHKKLIESKSVLHDKRSGYYRDFCMHGSCDCQNAINGGSPA